jgi:hypothetical protein
MVLWRDYFLLYGRSVKRFMNCKRLPNHIENFLESITVIIIEFLTLNAKINVVQYLPTVRFLRTSIKIKKI